MSRKAIAILAGSAATPDALATIPDTMRDLLQHPSWARTLTSDGFAAGAGLLGTFSVLRLQRAPALDYSGQ